MFIGCLTVDIFIPYSRSLKDKRRVLGQLKAKICNTFNISFAEKPSDKWQRSQFCCVAVNYRRDYLEGLLNNLEKLINLYGDIEVIDIQRDIF